MNTPSTLEMSMKLQSNFKTYRPITPLRDFARLIVRVKTAISIHPNMVSSGIAVNYRLGEAVHHGQFGSGRVMAHWPDGSLLVRFDGAAKSRLVFPSLLN
jgi:hypothetical protein